MANYYEVWIRPTQATGYRERQKTVYLQALKDRHYATAWDALWRAASEANLLMPHEHSHKDLIEQRANDLLRRFGWPDRHPESHEDSFEYESFC